VDEAVLDRGGLGVQAHDLVAVAPSSSAFERIDEEIKALNESKKEVFAEAKGEGFDVKVLKETLRLRKQDKDERDKQESLPDLYLRAMESAGSSQARAA
jgi:uncharacterized protein (UPF0335 family)